MVALSGIQFHFFFEEANSLALRSISALRRNDFSLSDFVMKIPAYDQIGPCLRWYGGRKKHTKGNIRSSSLLQSRSEDVGTAMIIIQFAWTVWRKVSFWCRSICASFTITIGNGRDFRKKNYGFAEVPCTAWRIINSRQWDGTCRATKWQLAVWRGFSQTQVSSCWTEVVHK